MILTPQEQESILPGVYRTSFNYTNGVPGIRPAESNSFNIPLELEELIKEDLTKKGHHEIITGKEKPSVRGDWSKRTYFPSIDSFLDGWKKGYETNVSQFGTNQVYNKLGFELFYVNWKPNSDFFAFGKHEGIQYIGDRADLNPILILADNNGMNDQRGYLNLGINDFRKLKVYVYRKTDDEGFRIRDKDKIDLTGNSPKILRNDLLYYTDYHEVEEFPFDSPNSLKSAKNMWTAVGISPIDIYSAIEKLGFVFPK